ncbi:phenol hydroxylase subunit [Ferribacterium limneticum]|uniref:phenol hydroxylase subunit n=1 Tax=Ferribacterium limneticum TaxID=76259 RepID=UPI001CF9F438|nr:phenol hydroxylase subunit [Ferribacterium limneticum]UCV27055.1 phenol hydroxylase [Ferribacterium limneticum]UCV30972.1 phenol hydroxylase [Ferribacterium limneticum]
MVESNFDITRKFVRVMRTLPNGLIEFEFAVGDPDVAAELVMPKAAFEEFCQANRVELLTEAKPQPSDANAADADFHWNLHQATHQRFR